MELRVHVCIVGDHFIFFWFDRVAKLIGFVNHYISSTVQNLKWKNVQKFVKMNQRMSIVIACSRSARVFVSSPRRYVNVTQ